MKDQKCFQPLLITLAALLCFISACSTAPSVTPARTPVINAGPGLHVVGNQIQTDGHVFTYHGVNRSGAEYKCTQKGGKSTFDGPADQASINAMLSWKITIIRVPLNEDCWLGINGEPANGTTAEHYRQDIINYVKLLRQNRLVVILDLHWAAPGSDQAVKQLPMPDADHALSFWSSVARAFKDDPYVVFDLFNEPYTMIWQCWLNGSSRAAGKPCNDVGYAVAGMQTLVNTVRATGAGNLILLGGLAYANDLYGWIQFKPRDPRNNLAASFHMYPGNGCNSTNCLDLEVAPIAQHYPVLIGEIGEFDCADTFLNTIMPWFDSYRMSYLAWAWDANGCSEFPALISDYDGAPTGYGIGFKQHLMKQL